MTVLSLRNWLLAILLYVSSAWTPRTTSNLLKKSGVPFSKPTRCSPLKSAISSDDTVKKALKPTPGCIVTVDCKLVPEGGFVPEPLFNGVVLYENEPSSTLKFWLGKGNYLPGLHECILAMEAPGDNCEASMDAGWGARNPDLVATASFKESGIDRGQIKPGVQLYLANGMKCFVTDINEEKDTFTIDANPPLAGASYKAFVKLLNVEMGPEILEYSDSAYSGTCYKVATFALGCFWGGELAFMREPGVVGTAVGYTHGMLDDPSYKQVCSGTTGHTEAILVVYDSDEVTYDRLVHVAMDRLGENKYLLNQVGNDRGTQYRHGVYYHNSEQKDIAVKIKESFGEDCVTEFLPAKKFWFAEDYHQQYLLKGGQSAKKDDKSVIRCYG